MSRVEGTMTEASPATSPDGNVPYHGTEPWLHNVCVAAAVLAPVGLLLPPRRMGPRSLLLAAGTFFATSQLTYDYTGYSLYTRFQQRASEVTASDLPEAAVRRQAAMRAERERRRKEQEQQQETESGRLHKLWMGNEKADWTKERARHEKEVLDSGGGYWELIMEQIGDVWTDLRKKNPGESENSKNQGQDQNQDQNQDQSRSSTSATPQPDGSAKR